MEKVGAPFHVLIRRVVTRQSEAPINDTIHLWERLACELTSIIGEGGFQSLYARSIHLLNPTHPWLAVRQSQVQTGSPFDDLKASLQARPANEASEASTALLIVFVGILVTLVGELLTANILRSAWGDIAPEPAAKEIEQ